MLKLIKKIRFQAIIQLWLTFKVFSSALVEQYPRLEFALSRKIIVCWFDMSHRYMAVNSYCKAS